VENRWSLWVFPEAAPPHEAALYGAPGWTWLERWAGLREASELDAVDGRAVLLTETLDEDVVDYLRGGGRAVLAAGEGLVRPHRPLFGYVKYFFTPPANYSPYEDGQNGTVVAEHPMLGDFPHGGYAGWPFFRMMENAPPLDLEPLGLADSDPVIRVIHRYPVLHPLAYFVERRVGEGRLVLCALELDPDWVEARWLLSAICRHVLRRGPENAPELSQETEAHLVRLTP
jgi:hypothetical protein